MANFNRTRHMRCDSTSLVFLLPLLAALWGAVAGAQETPVVSEAGSRSALALTVYNRDLALVREVRTADLPKGGFSLEFRDVPARIEARSLIVETGGGTGLRLLEQNYEFDLMSRAKILEKYVGRTVAWDQEKGGRIEGRLLGIAAGPVFEVNGEIVFEMPGRIVLPTLPGDLRARPTLVWLVETERAGEAEIEASYLTHGISWSADYVLQLDPEGRSGALHSWVSIDNRCGAAFEDTRLLLVAGDVNQAPRIQQDVMMSMELSRSAGAAVKEESLYDYHLYTVPGTTVLKDAQIKQISLFEAEDLTVDRHYRLSGYGNYYRGGGARWAEPKVEVHYAFENKRENNLGMPLPAGVFRVYGESSSGDRQLLGEDRIDHTPEKEKVELHTGSAFDIVAERIREDYRRTGNNIHETDFRVTLRNHKKEDVVVEVMESVGGVWKVLRSSHDSQKPTAETLRFDVDVPADGETVLTWTVQVTS